jgi:hypothetical protein
MEEKFVRLADLQKFPIRKDHYDREHGNENFIFGIETMFEYIDELPKYEIAVRGEVNVTDDVCQALVCCLNGDVNKSQVEVCTPCPFFHEGNCADLLKQTALDVILHQRATIEFLQKTIRENEQRYLEERMRREDEVAVEVARVIFEEIEGYTILWCGEYIISIEKLDELKKKYTEVEE